MSWLNFNDSLNRVKGQLSNLASNVLSDEENELKELRELCESQQQEIYGLRKVNEQWRLRQDIKSPNNGNQSDTSWSWQVSNQSTTPDNKDEIITDLKKQIVELENEKKDLIANLELLDSDFQQNTEKLASIKDKLQNDYNELEDKYVKLKDDHVALMGDNKKKESSELREVFLTSDISCKKCDEVLKSNLELQGQINNLKEEVKLLTDDKELVGGSKGAVVEDIASLEEKLKLSESEHRILVGELKKATETIASLQIKYESEVENSNKFALAVEDYKQQINSLKEELTSANTGEDVVEDKEQAHNKYISILTENIKRYADCEKPSDFENYTTEDDPHLREFSHQVENLMKILLELKSKCETLESDLYNVTQEKTNLLQEKNHEIEKLIHNSEILSQEVLTKTQTVKDYENECNELIKNNDLLISELEEYKNNSGLQTISESNEDNILLLESQLENANKRIEELEETLTKHQSETELTQDMERLNLNESSYLKLQEDFDNLKSENDSLKRTVEGIEEVETEKNELSAALERMRTDLENSEYQYAEANINMETLKDEVDNQKSKIGELVENNHDLEKLNTELKRVNEDIRTELNIIRKELAFEEDTRKQLEVQVRNLTEKLQNAKMCETSLKLQYDTISKELVNVSEGKSLLEVSLKNTLDDLKRCQDNFLLLQNENDEYRKQCENLQNKIKDDEVEISRRDEIIERLNVMEREYENLAVDESGVLLNSLHISNNGEGRSEDIEVESIGNKFETINLSEENNIDKVKQDTSVYLSTLEDLKLQLSTVIEEKTNLQNEVERLTLISNQHLQCSENISLLERKLKEINDAKNQLTNEIITKHQENVAYYSEIQRLVQVLNTEVEKVRNLEIQLQTAIDSEELKKKDEEIEKLTDQNGFLRQKCEVMAENLLQEQNKVQQVLAERSEKEQVLTKNLDRLQAHLIEVEEHYTQELLRAEERNAELLSKYNEIEQREKNSSTMYTSANIRANQHVETLQHQLQLITNQRDDLRKKISDAEDNGNKQAAALTNLQFVLEQFQKDKEKDIQAETERIRRQIAAEKRVQEDLKKEIANLQNQLEESKQGLQAASRLSDQLEQSRHLVSTLKIEVSQLKEKLNKTEEQLRSVSSQTDGKVDKSLIKNLIIGFVTTSNNLSKDQVQILRIIATVLDFNQQDHDKVNLSKPQQGWLSSLLSPQASQGMSQESLSHAFVKFLENESKPRVVPSLLNNNDETPKSRKSSNTSTSRQSPIVLSEVVLPTFADFAQNRNSSSILKDVLKDNS